MEKCKECNYRGEQWVGDNLDIEFMYCGLIESVIEDAIDIKDIKVCPIDLFKNTYREESRR